MKLYLKTVEDTYDLRNAIRTLDQDYNIKTEELEIIPIMVEDTDQIIKTNYPDIHYRIVLNIEGDKTSEPVLKFLREDDQTWKMKDCIETLVLEFNIDPDDIIIEPVVIKNIDENGVTAGVTFKTYLKLKTERSAWEVLGDIFQVAADREKEKEEIENDEL